MRTYTTWRGWPHAITGPYVLVFRWALSGSEAPVECVGLDLHTFADRGLPGVEHYRGPGQDRDPAPITAELWRSVPVRAVIEAERRSLAKELRASSDPRLRKIAESWARPRPRVGVLRRGDHERVATVYRDALRRGDNPTQAVARAFHLSTSAAAKRVARAREHGLLPPTTRGKAAGHRKGER